MTKLTKKQQAFVENKVAGCTNRDAAIAAGYAVSGASAMADKLLRLPAVRAAIKTAAPTVSAKPAAPVMPAKHYPNAMGFLIDAMNLGALPLAMRIDAAKALLPYQHAKLGEKGKKEKATERAAEVTKGGRQFVPKRPPELRVVKLNE